MGIRNWFGRRKPSVTHPVKDKMPLDTDAPDAPRSSGAGVLAGGFKTYDDRVRELNRDAYQTIRRTDVSAQPMRKLAERMSLMKVTVEGSGARAEAIKEILSESKGMPEALSWLSWGKIEGWRLMLMRNMRSGRWRVPDLRDGGRGRWQCGNGKDGWTYLYNGAGKGRDELVKIQETHGVGHGEDPDSRAAKQLPRDRFILFKPSASINPNGDLDLPYQLFLVAEAAALLDKAQRIYADRHALPIQLLKQLTDTLRPDELTAKLQSAADKLRTANARQTMAMAADEALKLVEPSGTTWQFLTEYRQQLERRAHRLILGEDTTSGSNDSPTNNTTSSEKMLDVAAFAMAKLLSGSLTEQLLPFIERTNPHLPKLVPGEQPIRIVVRPGSERKKISAAESVQLIKEGVPFVTDEIYEVWGMTRPEGTPDVLDAKTLKKTKPEEPKPFGGGLGAPPVPPPMGNTPAGNPRRPDRPSLKDPDSPDEGFRVQDPEADKRNLE